MKNAQIGWVLQDIGKLEGFAVDDPIEGKIFTTLLYHANVWPTRKEAEAAAKHWTSGLINTSVRAMEVYLNPKNERAQATAIVGPRNVSR